MFQIINRMRFHGIRKLNWVERTRDSKYLDHLRDTNLDQWIDLSPLTIIIGPNGGGKSTVIDLLRALAKAKLWPTLPRENYPSEDFSGFDIEGTHFKINARFSRSLPHPNQIFKFTNLSLLAKGKGGLLFKRLLIPKLIKEGEWEHIIQDVLDEFVGFQVYYLSATERILAHSLPDEVLVALLNELSRHFPTVLSNTETSPFCIFQGSETDSSRIGVLFKDDFSQHSLVNRDFFPLGWLQLVSVLSFLRGCKDGSLVLLDEPDRHLHPNLQRVMMEIILEEMKVKNIQVLIATHSSVLLNPELIKRSNAKVFVAARGQFSTLSDTRHLLDDLGVRSSDLVLANGIIWVEGPSDRIYIKTWLELYAKEYDLLNLIEGIHYSVVSYGGALIKYLTLSDKLPEKVNLDALNHNWFVVIDRDTPETGNHPLQREKVRIFEEAESVDRKTHVWITQDYTIEAYLPERFEHNIHRNKNGKVSVNGSKVELAQCFRKKILNWSESFRAETDIPERIRQLYEVINSWHKPQEM